MKTSELDIMRRLRINARESLTRMSRKTGIPVSTIHERLKRFEGSVIHKHTCLLDFRSLGFDIRISALLKVPPTKREAIAQLLASHHQVNSVFRINNGYEFLIEAVFRGMQEVQEFMDLLTSRGVRGIKEFYVLEELRREAFMTAEAHMPLLKERLAQ